MPPCVRRVMLRSCSRLMVAGCRVALDCGEISDVCLHILHAEHRETPAAIRTEPRPYRCMPMKLCRYETIEPLQCLVRLQEAAGRASRSAQASNSRGAESARLSVSACTMADADEVDTDEELRDAEVETTLAAGPALEVDTDEELKKKAGEDMPAQILWGSYQSAKVKTVQQGMYHVKFDDGASRWATCSELVLGDAAVPVHLLQDGMPILRPEVDDSTIDFAAPSFAPPAGAPGTARSGRSTARSSSTTPRVKSTRKFTRHLLLQGKLKRRG